jgi:hypothetical protein
VGYEANNEHQKPELLRPCTHPIKLFDSGTILRAYTLVESLSTPAGVLIATFRRAGEVETASF